MTPERSWRWSDGQAIVELALVLPVVLFGTLGALEAAFLVTDKADQDRATATVATYAASHDGDESWHAVAAHELPGCDVEASSPLPDLLTIEATCTYEPRLTSGLWDGLPIGSSESAALDPQPTASPEPSPTVEP